jgi:DNA mismatch repair ATPase MutS
MGRTQHSLIGTMDYTTKTSVGGRLLRTTLIAPPAQLDSTINARLDLVDTFLQDEEALFYVVLHHLQALPAIDTTKITIGPHTIANLFSESTTYARNSHTMLHQECFAPKSTAVLSGVHEDS